MYWDKREILKQITNLRPRFIAEDLEDYIENHNRIYSFRGIRTHINGNYVINSSPIGMNKVEFYDYFNSMSNCKEKGEINEEEFQKNMRIAFAELIQEGLTIEIIPNSAHTTTSLEAFLEPSLVTKNKFNLNETKRTSIGIVLEYIAGNHFLVDLDSGTQQKLKNKYFIPKPVQQT